MINSWSLSSWVFLLPLWSWNHWKRTMLELLCNLISPLTEPAAPSRRSYCGFVKWEVKWEEREGREVWTVTMRVLYRQLLFTHGPTSASIGPWVGGLPQVEPKETVFSLTPTHLANADSQALQWGSVSIKTPGRDGDGCLLQDNPEEVMAMGWCNGKENPEWCSQPERKLWSPRTAHWKL